MKYFALLTSAACILVGCTIGQKPTEPFAIADANEMVIVGDASPIAQSVFNAASTNATGGLAFGSDLRGVKIAATTSKANSGSFTMNADGSAQFTFPRVEGALKVSCHLTSLGPYQARVFLPANQSKEYLVSATRSPTNGKLEISLTTPVVKWPGEAVFALRRSSFDPSEWTLISCSFSDN